MHSESIRWPECDRGAFQAPSLRLSLVRPRRAVDCPPRLRSAHACRAGAPRCRPIRRRCRRLERLFVPQHRALHHSDERGELLARRRHRRQHRDRPSTVRDRHRPPAPIHLPDDAKTPCLELRRRNLPCCHLFLSVEMPDTRQMYRSSGHNAERNQASQLARELEPARQPSGFGLVTTASLRSMGCLDGSLTRSAVGCDRVRGSHHRLAWR